MFALGFQKIAMYARHNDGTEFKIQDTEPSPYVAGVGGMSPSGIPSYKPTETTGMGKPKYGPQLSPKAAEKQRALDIAMLSKMASLGDPRDSTAYVGTQGQGADTLCSQFKYESGFNNITEGMGYNKTKAPSRLMKNLKQLYKGAKK
jgi:hypothetical protein